ncbi:hypothetical protein [Actinoplanes sp. URMC 104]|uniref:hypothetical protein n=1 Tax=Actinoplanes sp. URMC 104 TaxID=3423409 RepID=UPI003F1C51CC
MVTGETAFGTLYFAVRDVALARVLRFNEYVDLTVLAGGHLWDQLLRDCQSMPFRYVASQVQPGVLQLAMLGGRTARVVRHTSDPGLGPWQWKVLVDVGAAGEIPAPRQPAAAGADRL